MDWKVILGPSATARENEETADKAEMQSIHSHESNDKIDPSKRASILLKLFKMTFESLLQKAE